MGQLAPDQTSKPGGQSASPPPGCSGQACGNCGNRGLTQGVGVMSGLDPQPFPKSTDSVIFRAQAISFWMACFQPALT